MNSYRLGNLHFTVEGEDPVVGPLREELVSARIENGTPPAIRFRFVRELRDLDQAVRVSPLEVSSQGYEARAGKIRYRVFPGNEFVDVQLASELRQVPLALPTRRYKRFKDWNYLWPEEMVAKDFMYNVFDYITQIVHLEAGASHIHASSFERYGRGVAIVAWGGIGKTTSLLKLVAEDGWRFLSDDLGLIDREGRLYRTPKKMQIYAYNVAGQPHLREALLSGRPVADRASWVLKRILEGPKGVRRRVSAEELFGANRVGSSAALERLFFIERVGVSKIESRKIGIDQIAERAATILLNELQPFADLSIAMHSTKHRVLLPHVTALWERSRDVLKAAFAGQDARYVAIPFQAGPDELASFIRNEIE